MAHTEWITDTGGAKSPRVETLHDKVALRVVLHGEGSHLRHRADAPTLPLRVAAPITRIVSPWPHKPLTDGP